MEKSDFNFWCFDDLIWEEYTPSDFININRWENGLIKQDKLWDTTFNKFDEIYNFLSSNDINGLLWKDYIFWTLNPKIINLFLSFYKNNPYNLFNKTLLLGNDNISNNNINNFNFNWCITDTIFKLYNSDKISKEVSEKIINNILSEHPDCINDIYKNILEELISLTYIKLNPISNNNGWCNKAYYISEIYEIKGEYKELVTFIYFFYNLNKNLSPEFDIKYLSKVVSTISKKEFYYKDNIDTLVEINK